jgi:hypothetical protein
MSYATPLSWIADKQLAICEDVDTSEKIWQDVADSPQAYISSFAHPPLNQLFVQIETKLQIMYKG